MNQCIFCSRNLKRELSLRLIFSFNLVKTPIACQKCKERFRKIEPLKSCPGCSRMQENVTICLDCEKWLKYSPELEPNHMALFIYNDVAREYMNQFKFQGDVKLAALFGEVLHQKLMPYMKTHHIMSIPTSTSSFQKRGFNPVDLLLQYANVDHEPLLKHVTKVQMQSSKTRGERLKSTQPFEIISHQRMKDLKKPVLIVDDVYTTGRTIYHARELLRKSVNTTSFSLFR